MTSLDEPAAPAEAPKVEEPQGGDFKPSSPTITEQLRECLKDRDLNAITNNDIEAMALQFKCSKTLVSKVIKQIDKKARTAGATPSGGMIKPPIYGSKPAPLESPPTLQKPITPVPPFEMDLEMCKALGKLPYEILGQFLNDPSLKLSEGEVETSGRGWKQLLDFYMPQIAGEHSPLAVFALTQGMVIGGVFSRYMEHHQPKPKPKPENAGAAPQ